MNLINMTQDDYNDVAAYIAMIRNRNGYFRIPVSDAVSMVFEFLVRYPYDPSRGSSEKTYLFLVTKTCLNNIFKLNRYNEIESISKFSDDSRQEELNYFLIDEEVKLDSSIIFDYINDHPLEYKYLNLMIESDFNITYKEMARCFDATLQQVKNGVFKEKRKLAKIFKYEDCIINPGI